jgi:heat shock protein HslJ
MFKSKLYIVITILGVLSLVAGACVQLSPVQADYGTLKLYVTDERSREEVSSILVTVSELQVHKALAEQEREQEQQQSTTGDQVRKREQEQQQTEQGQGEWISVNIDETARTFDLFDIEGIEQYLGQIEIEAAKYTQVRLVIETVQVSFNSGGSLEDARIPSKELKIVHPFNIVRGETTALVIDFDADKMVTVTGSGEIIVKPVVKLTVRQEKSQGREDKTKQEVSLEDTKWVLQSYGEPGNPEDILADTEITAEFVSSERTIRGSAGCNSYFGGYELEGNRISIPGPIGATEMYCVEPEEIMEQEQEYLAMLQNAETYDIKDDQLRIFTGDEVLIFELD